MMLADLLLIVHPGHDCAAAAGVAARLAARHGARVEGVCLAPLPALQPEDCYVMGSAAIRTVVERLEHEAEGMAARAVVPVREAMARAACEFAWTVAPPGEATADTAVRARLADMAVMTRPGAGQSVALALAETLIRYGAAPCLLTPEAWDCARPLDHAVVAWNGSRQAKRAMDDALPLLRDAKRVSVLTLDGAQGEEDRRAGLAAHLRRHGVEAEMAVAAADKDKPGAALLGWCGDNAADLLVMGAFGRTPRAERWSEGATWTVLTKAQLPVLMSC